MSNQKPNPGDLCSDYEIIPILENNEVVRGNNLVIKLYVAGFGIPKGSKIHLTIPDIDLDDKIEYYQPFASKFTEDGESYLLDTGAEVRNEISKEGSLVIKGTPGLFLPDNNAFEGDNFSLRPAHGEVLGGEGAARITIPVSKNSDPGKKELALTLTILNENKQIDTKKEKIGFEILKRHQFVIRNNKEKIIFSGLLLALLSFLVDGGSIITNLLSSVHSNSLQAIEGLRNA